MLVAPAKYAIQNMLICFGLMVASCLHPTAVAMLVYKYLLYFSLFYSIFFSSVLYLKRISSYFQLLCSTQNSLYLSYSAPYCLYSIQFDSIQSFSIIFHSCISFNSCPQGHDTLNLISTSNQFCFPPCVECGQRLAVLMQCPKAEFG